MGYDAMKDRMRLTGQAEASKRFFETAPGYKGLQTRKGSMEGAPYPEEESSKPKESAEKLTESASTAPAEKPIEIEESPAPAPKPPAPKEAVIKGTRRGVAALPEKKTESVVPATVASKPETKFERLRKLLEAPVDFGDTMDRLRRDAQGEQTARFLETAPNTSTLDDGAFLRWKKASLFEPETKTPEKLAEPDQVVRGTGGYEYMTLANGDIKIVKSPRSKGGQIIPKGSSAHKAVLSDIEAVRKNPSLGRVPFGKVTPLPEEMTVESKK